MFFHHSMETLMFDKSPRVVKREQRTLEQQLQVKITIAGRKITIEGNPLDEYVALSVLDAVAFGFSLKEALTLKDEDISFRKIHIRDFTRRKNLKDVRSRLIGREGKTKRTIEEISNCIVVIGESEVGIIGSVESIDAATQGAINIIKGSKQANAYRYLERMNAEKKKMLDDLGLKINKKEEQNKEEN